MKRDISNKEVYQGVQSQIDNLVDMNVFFSVPVSEEEINKARNGDFNIFHSENKAIPREWFPSEMKGLKVLCLAGAGGQQAPIIAATGADVTVLDLSEKMLKQDEYVAKRDGLLIKTEHGNMCDLSRFFDESFDMIINPSSLMYIPDVIAVFKECYRVLKNGGTFIMKAPNPLDYICDFIEDGGYYKVCNKMPYKSYEHDDQGDWIEFGHTLESLIGEQIKCGFYINGFFEDKGSDLLGNFCSTCFVTRAIKI